MLKNIIMLLKQVMKKELHKTIQLDNTTVFIMISKESKLYSLKVFIITLEDTLKELRINNKPYKDIEVIYNSLDSTNISEWIRSNK